MLDGTRYGKVKLTYFWSNFILTLEKEQKQTMQKMYKSH